MKFSESGIKGALFVTLTSLGNHYDNSHASSFTGSVSESDLFVDKNLNMQPNLLHPEYIRMK